MTGNGSTPTIIAKIEIVMFSDGNIGYKHQVPSRYIFNGMMRTAEQNMLAELMQAEQQKVTLPDVDVSRLKI